MKTRIFSKALCLLVLCSSPVVAAAQESPYSFSGDAAVVSKYIWRGQRLTNDWSLQPSMTLGVSGFSFNAWGTMDLTAVNEGDSLFLPENPLAPPGGSHNGLRGKFSEIDYTFSYSRSLEPVSVEVGTIFYTFPERQASLPSTTEIYGGVTFDSVPFAPSAKLYIDVDETRAGGGSTGLYFLVGAGHSLEFPHPVFTGLDISGSVSFVNNGFGAFYYGSDDTGAHDSTVSVGLPIRISEQLSATAFISYSALLRGFRGHQFQDPREFYLGTAGSPNSYADTVWGGFSVSLGF